MDCKRISCDVLVVGAGPSGGSAAYEAASRGLDVVILERRRKIGLPVQCAEYIPTHLVFEVDIPPYIKVQRIEGMMTHMPDGEVITTRVPGFIINRDKLDRYLIERAVSKGARLYLETKAISYDGRIVRARMRDGMLDIAPRVIIGADGPLSTVGSWVGITNQEFVQAVQYVMPLVEKKTHTQVYFSQDIPGGYGWVFPKLGVANVGVGINPRFRVMPKIALNTFIKKLIRDGVIKEEVIKKMSGLIPVGGLLRLHKKNIVLVGDAGGLAHPITGAGISAAIYSGKLAGEFVWHGLVKDNRRFLSEYEIECREMFFDTFTLARKKRNLLERYWMGGIDDLSTALKWGWVAFKEYYKSQE